MKCENCKILMDKSWNFCPNCGLKIESQLSTKKLAESKIPERFVSLVSEYQALTGINLTREILDDFINHPKVGPLSMIDSKRRETAAKKVRKALGNGEHSLSIDDWLDAIYANPTTTNSNRVWITSGGAKYHLKSDCPGINAGQNYAQAKGKEIYKPQFVLLRDAAYIYEYKPCDICKPPKYSN